MEPCYFREAGRLGKRIGELGWQLIYGGTNIGLMREVADATIRQGGEVTGINRSVSVTVVSLPAD